MTLVKPGTDITPGASPSPEGGVNPSPQADPSPIKLSPDALIQLEGQDKPVKFADYTKGFQSTATRAAQEKARLAAELEKVQKQYDTRDNEYKLLEQRLQALTASQQAAQPDELIEALNALPYLTGAEASRVVKHLREELQGFGQHFQQRDQAIALLFQQLQQMKGVVESFNRTHQSSTFEQKIAKFVDELGYSDSPEVSELAKELYLAYEGDDLDLEFPTILKNRIEQIQNWIRRQDKQKVEQAKRQPFTPGRGGVAVAPKVGLDLRGKSADEIGSAVWDMISSGEET